MKNVHEYLLRLYMRARHFFFSIVSMAVKLRISLAMSQSGLKTKVANAEDEAVFLISHGRK